MINMNVTLCLFNGVLPNYRDVPYKQISYRLGVGEMGFLHDELLNSNFAMDDGITSVLELLDLFCSWICFARA